MTRFNSSLKNIIHKLLLGIFDYNCIEWICIVLQYEVYTLIYDIIILICLLPRDYLIMCVIIYIYIYIPKHFCLTALLNQWNLKNYNNINWRCYYHSIRKQTFCARNVRRRHQSNIHMIMCNTYSHKQHFNSRNVINLSHL